MITFTSFYAGVEGGLAKSDEFHHGILHQNLDLMLKLMDFNHMMQKDGFNFVGFTCSRC